MSVYIKDRALNNLEGNQGTTAFYVDAVAKEGARAQADTLLEVDDIIAIGYLPAYSVTTDLRVIMDEAFPIGTTFDIGFALFGDSEDVIGISPIITDMVVDKDHRTIVLPMPTEGLVTPEDGIYTGDRGSIYTGNKPILLVALLKTGTQDGTGKFTLLGSHSYTATKGTGVYLS